MSIIEYLYTGFPITPSILEIIEQINGNFVECFKHDATSHSGDLVTLYHGSPYAFPDRFTALSFFSTTTQRHIAEIYALGGRVYEIKVPLNFPFLNLRETLNYHILLPIGTTFTRERECPRTYRVSYDNPDGYTLINSTLSRGNMESLTLESLVNFSIIDSSIDSAKDLTKRRRLLGSSLLKMKTDGYETYVIKSVLKRNDDYTDRPPSYVACRVITEFMASRIYETFGLNALKLKIVKENGTLCLQSKYMGLFRIDRNDYRNVLKGFLVDCILSNWDIINNDNIKKDRFGNIVRVDVGGALGYRGNGDFKMEFFDRSQPIEHKLFLKDEKSLFRTCVAAARVPAQAIWESFDKFVDFAEIEKKLDSIRDEISTYVLHDKLKQLIDKTIESVKFRMGYYASDAAKREILELIQDIPSMSGGARVEYRGETRRVYGKRSQYILFERKKIYLDTIKRKYKWAGGAPPAQTDPCGEQEASGKEIAFSAVYDQNVNDCLFRRLTQPKPKHLCAGSANPKK